MEKLYYSIDDDSVMSFQDVAKCYADYVSANPVDNANLTLNEYINNQLTEKNGCLEEVKPISDKNRLDLIEKAEAFRKAFNRFYFALNNNVSEESFNLSLAKKYPFAYSFNEMSFSLNDWLDEVIECTEDNKLFKL